MSKEREFFQRIVDWYDDDAENLAKFVEEIRAYLAELELKSDPDSVDLQSRCRGDKL